MKNKHLLLGWEEIYLLPEGISPKMCQDFWEIWHDVATRHHTDEYIP